MTAGISQDRRNLVIVRAGRDSLHRRWLDRGNARSWDLLISSYDRNASFQEERGVSVTFCTGGKWDGIYRALKSANLLERYDYVWLPDDDIDATAATIDEMFALMRKHDLAVGQPALTHDSYFSHFITNRCPGFALRYTNHVEIMVPCLRTSHLAQVFHEFESTMSGFGLDYLWCRIGEAGPGKSGIFDTVTVRHTRPVGPAKRALQSEMSKAGISPQAEEEALKARYGIRRRIVPIAYAAIDERGHKIDGRRRLGLQMAARYLADLPSFTDRRYAAQKIVQLVRRQLSKPFDLSPLPGVRPGDESRRLTGTRASPHGLHG
jgi:hypothetical protein